MSLAAGPNHEASGQALRWLESLQQCRADLDASESETARLRGVIRSVEKRMQVMDESLASYCAKTKNPFKLLLSRMVEPGAMRRERKSIEAEIKAISTELRDARKASRELPVPEEPAGRVVAAAVAHTAARHHVIITGTGRAGTTFLMELLTALGLETGYQHYSTLVNSTAHAGLERDIREPDAPYIIKNPALCDYLEEVLQGGQITIDHAFVPVRDLGQAARSRARVSTESGATEKSVWGGFWDAGDAGQQEMVLTQKLCRLIVTLAQHNVETTLLAFPRLVEDSRYLYGKLTPILAGMSFETFEEVFNRVARPDLVTRGL